MNGNVLTDDSMEPHFVSQTKAKAKANMSKQDPTYAPPKNERNCAHRQTTNIGPIWCAKQKKPKQGPNLSKQEHKA